MTNPIESDTLKEILARSLVRGAAGFLIIGAFTCRWSRAGKRLCNGRCALLGALNGTMLLLQKTVLSVK